MAWIIKFPGGITATLDKLNGWTVEGSPELRHLLDSEYDPWNVPTSEPDKFAYVAKRAAKENGGRIIKHDPRKRREETYFEPIY